MKKILEIAIVVLSILALTIPNGHVNANSFECDSNCINKALSGEMSSEEIKYYGTGNLVRALTSYFNGDVWKALKTLNLAPDSYTADTTVNAVYNTTLDGTVTGLYVCQSGWSYCSENQILGYIQEEGTIFRVICTPNKDCKTKVLFENEPNNMLDEVFNQSRYYGGSGEWK